MFLNGGVFILLQLIFQENFPSLRAFLTRVKFPCHLLPRLGVVAPSNGGLAHGGVLGMAVCHVKRLNCLFNSQVTNYLISTYAICLHSCDRRR